MDILNSKIINIEGRLYVDYSEERLDEEDFFDQDTTELTSTDPIAKLEEHESREYREVVPCPNALLKYVIGFHGQTIKKLRNETGTRIDTPKGRSSGSITITAQNQSKVEAAITRIQLLLSEKRWKEPFQHFVSIPLTEQTIKDGFNSFKEQVLSGCEKDRGICEKLFQDQNKIHLTIGTLVLLDDSESKTAIEIIENIQKSDVMSQAKGAKVRVCGVEYMNDDPSMVDVLYAKVSCLEKPGLLQKLADHIVSKFVESGLMKKEHEHVKLHATIMNTIRTMERKPAKEKGAKTNLKRETFNATNVLSGFRDYYFGEFLLNEIHISKMHSTDKNGYYESLHIAKVQ